MKHRLNRVCALLLAVILTVSLLPAPAVKASTFHDVPDNAWYSAAVEYVRERGWMEGVGGGAFDPKGTVTRGMFVTILARYAGVELDNDSPAFSDTTAGRWYTGAAAWAAENGIAAGVGSDCFAPNRPLTRQDMALMLYRFVDVMGLNLPNNLDRAFSDLTSGELASYARPAVVYCAGTGLLTGFEDSSFRPLSTATRAQAAAILARLDALVQENSEPMPAQSFESPEQDGVAVSVNAPEGALPEGVEMTVVNLEDRDVNASLYAAVPGRVVMAADISFTRDGEQLEPKTELEVTIALAELAAVENPVVVHMKSNGEVEVIPSELVPAEPEAAPASILGNLLAAILPTAQASGPSAIRFRADSFSIYAIIDGSTGEYARLKLQFKTPINIKDGPDEFQYQLHDEEPVWVTYRDYQVVDPNTGYPYESALYLLPDETIPANPPGHMIFFGWTFVPPDSPDYTPALIDGNHDRQYLAQQLKYLMDDDPTTVSDAEPYVSVLPIQEGESGETASTLNIYPIIFDFYTVTYMGEYRVTVIDTEPVFEKPTFDPDTEIGTSDGRVDYVVSCSYEPVDPNLYLLHWHNENDSVQYANGDTYSGLSEDLVLYAHVSSGAWVTYNENCPGATYVPPVFLDTTSSQTTTAPALPTAQGYDCDPTGWYTADSSACYAPGTPIPVTADMTLYAHWTPRTDTPYRVQIWTQSADDAANAAAGDKTYTLYRTDALTGTSGADLTLADAYTELGNNGSDPAGALGDGFAFNADKSASTTEPVSIEGDGSTVLNVYYDRTPASVVTYSFTDNSNSSAAYSISGYPGGEVTGWPAPQAGWVWEDVTDPSNPVRLQARPAVFDTNRSFENVPVSTGRLVKYVCFNDGDEDSLEVWDVYTLDTNESFTVSSDFLPDCQLAYAVLADSADSMPTLATAAASGALTGSYEITSASPQIGETLWLYFRRDTFTLTCHIGGDAQTQSIPFGAPVSEPAAPTVQEGEIFTGWYYDPTFTQPVDFTALTMPRADLNLYAGIHLKQYRVFLHTNEPATHTDWAQFVDVYGRPTSFLKDYGSYISNGVGIPVQLTGFRFLGWYTDPECTQPFDFATTTLSDLVTAPYDQTEDTGSTPGYNEDAAENRAWVVRKLDLYAEWEAYDPDADGIHVMYNAGDGYFSDGSTTWSVWTDLKPYSDGALSEIHLAPTPTDSDKVFLGWEILDSAGNPVNSGNLLEPGLHFHVEERYSTLTVDLFQEVTDIRPNEDYLIGYKTGGNVYLLMNFDPVSNAEYLTFHTSQLGLNLIDRYGSAAVTAVLDPAGRVTAVGTDVSGAEMGHTLWRFGAGSNSNYTIQSKRTAGRYLTAENVSFYGYHGLYPREAGQGLGGATTSYQGWNLVNDSGLGYTTLRMSHDGGTTTFLSFTSAFGGRNMFINVYRQTAGTGFSTPNAIEVTLYRRMPVLRLRAVYGEKHNPEITFINWYDNYAEDIYDGETVVVNKAQEIPFPTLSPYSETHTFLGWAKRYEQELSPGTESTDVEWKQINGVNRIVKYKNLTSDDLYLRYDATTNTFSKNTAQPGEPENWVTVTHVAANEQKPFDAMYAVWIEGNCFYVVHTASGLVEAIPITEVAGAATYDLTRNLTDGTFYGGYYSAYGGVTAEVMQTLLQAGVNASGWVTGSGSGSELIPTGWSLAANEKVYTGFMNSASFVRYDGTWPIGQTKAFNKSNALTSSGKTVKPAAAGAIYFVKEIPNSYLQTRYLVLNRDGKVKDIYLYTTIDDTGYLTTQAAASNSGPYGGILYHQGPGSLSLNDRLFYGGTAGLTMANSFTIDFETVSDATLDVESVTRITPASGRKLQGVLLIKRIQTSALSSGSLTITAAPLLITPDGVPVGFKTLEISLNVSGGGATITKSSFADYDPTSLFPNPSSP